MFEEKMLTKKEHNNIFKKALSIIISLFSKTTEENKSLNIRPQVKSKSLIDEFHRNKKMLNIQSQFESGTIKEVDLAEEEKVELIKLYNQQINDLQKDIQNYTRTLELYNKKIQFAEKKLNSNN